MRIEFKFVVPEKALSPILVNWEFSSKLTLENVEATKEDGPIDLTEAGMVMESIFFKSLKTELPMVSNLEFGAKVIEVKPAPSNAELPILVTLLGIVTELKSVE